MMTKNTTAQSGNALWFILIAIVLLGGLTVVLTRSSSTTDDSGDYERNQIQVSEFVRFAKGIEMGISNMKSRGCSENQINFETTGLTGHDNPGAPGDASCDVFSDKGGGMVYKPIPPIYLDAARSAEPRFGQWVFTGALNVANIGTDGGAASTKELLAIAPFVTQEFCRRINDFVGVANVGNVPPKEDNTPKADFLVPFIGTFGGGVDIDGNGNAAGPFAYKSSGCTTAQNEDSYYYYQVLIAR